MTGDDFIQRDLAAHPLPISPGYKTSMFRGPTRPPLSLKTGMADLTGPIFGVQELGARDNDLILNYAKEGLPIGERIIIHGRVLDGNARPLRGAACPSSRIDQTSACLRAAFSTILAWAGFAAMRASAWPKAVSSRQPRKSRPSSSTCGV